MEVGIQWPLVLFSLFAGSGGCLFAFVGLSEVLKTGEKARFIATAVAFVLLILGGIFSMLHLASPQNVMAAVTNIFSFSGISVELIVLGICAILMFAYLVVLKREGSQSVLKALGIAGIACGCLMAFVSGHGYLLDAKPAWSSETLALAYLGSSLSVGGFLFALVEAVCKVDAEQVKKISPFVFASAAIGVVCMIAYLVFLGGRIGGQEALAFGGVVACGMVVPLVCGVLLMKKQDWQIAMSAGGFAGALIGGLSIRILMWALAAGYLTLFAADMSARVLLGF